MPLPDEFPVWDAFDPSEKGKRRVLTFSRKLVLRLAKYDAPKLNNHRAVREVVRKPFRIYRNTRQLGDGYFGYCGRPEFRYDLEGGPVPFPPNLLLLVYLAPGGIIHDYSFEDADENDNRHVKGYERRYGGDLWP